jgi:hypothetical protein
MTGERLANKALLITLATTTGALVLLAIAAGVIVFGAPVDQRVDYLKVWADVLQAFLVGVGVTLAGILIPAVLSEARQDFERLRESRLAYSQAKTGVEYLPLRLAGLSFKDAAKLIQHTHTDKHMAELYPELESHLKRRQIEKTPKQWGDGLYSTLYDLRHVLEEHAGEWDTLTPQARLALIRKVCEEPRKAPLEPGALGADYKTPSQER